MDDSSILNPFTEEDPHGLILQSLEDGVYLVDTERRITYWNEGAERITGYLAQDVIGRRCDDHLLSCCDENGRTYCSGGCPLAATLTDGKSHRMNVFLKHHISHRVAVSVRSAPVREAGGLIVGAVEVFHEDTRHYGLVQRFHGLEPYGCLDPDTGIGNRDVIGLRLHRRLEDLRIFGIPFGLILLQFPGHDELATRYGQEAWLSLLRAAAQTVAHTMPADGFLGRWDDIRFMAVLGNCDPISLQQTSARLANLVRATEIPWWGDSLRLAVSVRTTMAEPDDSPESVVDRLIEPA
jgi:GGDEF domain-containing protein